jgi:hypothetical protein
MYKDDHARREQPRLKQYTDYTGNLYSDGYIYSEIRSTSVGIVMRLNAHADLELLLQ